MSGLEIKYTPFGSLKAGDEFIRYNRYPVLLRDLEGERLGTTFKPSLFGHGRAFDIRRMVPSPDGGLREVHVEDLEMADTRALQEPVHRAQFALQRAQTSAYYADRHSRQSRDPEAQRSYHQALRCVEAAEQDLRNAERAQGVGEER